MPSKHASAGGHFALHMLCTYIALGRGGMQQNMRFYVLGGKGGTFVVSFRPGVETVHGTSWRPLVWRSGHRWRFEDCMYIGPAQQHCLNWGQVMEYAPRIQSRTSTGIHTAYIHMYLH